MNKNILHIVYNYHHHHILLKISSPHSELIARAHRILSEVLYCLIFPWAACLKVKDIIKGIVIEENVQSNIVGRILLGRKRENRKSYQEDQTKGNFQSER